MAQYCFKLIRDKQNNKLDNPNVKQKKPKEVEPKAESKKKLSKLRRNAQKKAEKEKKQLSANLAHMEYAYSLPAVSHNEVFNALSKETKEKFRKNVILDNGANVNITNNIKFLRDVRPVEPVFINGVSSQPVEATMAGNFLDFGFTYFVECSPFTIVAFNSVKTNFAITYDQPRDEFVCKPNGNGEEVRYKFACSPVTQLYHMSLNGFSTKECKKNSSKIVFAQTYALPSGKVFTPEQIARATAHEAGQSDGRGGSET